MRVLLTNVHLAARAGTEINLRDWSLGLLRRGHSPIVYSPLLGEVAAEIAAAGVPVIDSLARLRQPPDVIHGCHHPTVMAALNAFPGVPALVFYQDFTHWADAPLRHPRAILHVAIDATLRGRLLDGDGFDPDCVRQVLNAVDTERFQLRPPLPPRPARALAYCKTGEHLAALRQACALRGLSLDEVGFGSGKPIARPEDLLGDYDLVFASGRCAMEAMAAGTAVVCCDARGFAGPVTPASYERWRPLNFGRRCLLAPVTLAAALAAIDSYDAAAAAIVAARFRQEGSLEVQLGRIEQLYDEARSRFAAAPADPAAERAAVTRYLEAWSPRTGGGWPWMDERVAFEAHVDALLEQVDRIPALREEAIHLRQQLKLKSDRLEELRAELARLRSQGARSRAD